MTTRRGRGDDGFTLIELLVSIVILGLIMTAVTGVVISYLKDTNSTVGRLQESHDAQISSAYFTQDVESAGVRATTTPFALQSSIDDSGSGSWPYPCAAAGTSPLIRFAWNDYVDTAGDLDQVRVAYVLNGTRAELHRLTCKNNATVATDTLLAHELDPGNQPTASCLPSPSCASYTTTLPSTVSMILTIRDQYHVGSTFTVTLTGHPRQAT
jgi:prepilin-type N-terminal cleavage/methylation domain-containing protein